MSFSQESRQRLKIIDLLTLKTNFFRAERAEFIVAIFFLIAMLFSVKKKGYVKGGNNRGQDMDTAIYYMYLLQLCFFRQNKRPAR